MLTLLALLGIQAVFLILGLGITSRVAHLRRTGWAVLLGPIVGHVALILLGLRLCAGFTTGGRAVLIATALLATLTLLSARFVGEAFQTFVGQRDLLWLLLVCAGLQIVLAAAPILVGIDTYNGYGNPDAWYYTTDIYLLKDRDFFDIVDPAPFTPHLHTVGITRVGPEMSVLLASWMCPDELVGFNLVLASFLLLVPLTAGFLCREVLGLEPRWTCLGVALVGAHSSLQLVYCYQHLGHVFSLALTPLALAALWVSLERRDGVLAVFAAFMAAGCAIAYWPTLPLFAAPAMLLLPLALLARRAEPRLVILFALAFFAIGLSASPTAFMADLHAAVSVSSRLVSRNDPALVAFNPYLTEDLLPLYAGLTESGTLSELWLRLRPEQYDAGLRTAFAYLAMALAFLVVATVGVWSEARGRRPFVPVAIAVYAGMVVYVFRQEYGYGLYKLVSWTHLLLVLSFVLGARTLWRQGLGWPPRIAKAFGAAVVLGYLWLNAATGSYYALRSLSSATGRFVTLQNFARNPDWRALEGWAARHPEGPILIGMHHHVAQYWAAYRLRRARYALLVPQDPMGAVSRQEQLHNIALRESFDPSGPVEREEDALALSKYLLDWTARNDITWNQMSAPPVEENRTFRLYRLQDVKSFLSLHDGWYPFENYDPFTGKTIAFRWMKQRASLLLFRFPRQPVRLSLGLRAGIGADRLERTLRVTHQGHAVANLRLEGSGRLLSDPFTPQTDSDLVEIEVAEPSRPTRRLFSLWNAWVERDPRGLSAGVYDVRALSEQDLGSAWGVTRGSYSAEDIRRTFFYDGLHSDDWLGARFRLAIPAGIAAKVVVRGRLVHLAKGDLPFRIGVTVNGMPQRAAVFDSYGDITFGIDVPRAPGESLDWVELTPEHSLEVESSYIHGQDLRKISLQLKSLEIQDGR